MTKRMLLVLAAMGSLASCTSPVAGLLIGTVMGGDAEPATAPAAPRIDRGAIKRADVAAVFVSSAETGAMALTIAAAKRGNAITYVSPEQRSVVLDGSLIAATRGFGVNLQATSAARTDPLVLQTLPSDWPKETQRTYFFAGQGPDYVPVVAQCKTTVGPTQTVDVLGADRRGTVVTEVCKTDSGIDFTNIHLISPQTGDMWMTSQWTGPVQGMLNIQTVEPFSGD